MSYNLEDIKETSINLIDFGDHKINELYIQQNVQSMKLCMRETAKTNNWLTTSLRLLVLITNVILFFGLEINQDNVIENPSSFCQCSNTTNCILKVLSILMCAGFIYISIFQVIIMYKIQSHWALKDGNKKKTCCKNFCKTLVFMARNYEKTLESRNIW